MTRIAASVRVQDIIDRIHESYARAHSKTISMLVQENAEAQATVDDLTRQLEDAHARLAALTAIPTGDNG